MVLGFCWNRKESITVNLKSCLWALRLASQIHADEVRYLERLTVMGIEVQETGTGKKDQKRANNRAEGRRKTGEAKTYRFQPPPSFFTCSADIARTVAVLRGVRLFSVNGAVHGLSFQLFLALL